MTTQRSTTAIAYVRCSTREQGDSRLGLEAQEATIRSECEHRGWTLIDVATDVESAKSTKRRPALAATLARLDAGEADVLIVQKLDRLSRSIVDLASLIDRAAANGWKLTILDVDVDTTTASGELVVNVMGSVAQWERRAIGERTKAALAAKKAQGCRLGRPVLIPGWVQDRILGFRDEGHTFRAIANWLNVEGVPTAQGGARWHASTVRSVLRSLELDAEAHRIRAAQGAA